MIDLRRAALVAAAALGLAACTEVKQEPMPQQLALASFASPNIPTPNDLALAAIPTLTSPALGAQKELLQAFVDSGGFPNDQEVPLTIPFRSQTWNGSTYVVDATPPDIDVTTVTENTVTVLKLGATTAEAVPFEFSVELGTGILTIRKVPGANGRRWDPGARYVFAVRGGPNGVKTTTGKTVAPDTAITLVIPNRDLTKRENQPLGSIPDTSNPPNGNADEIAQLEGVRAALWSPVNWHAVDPGTGTKVWAPNAADPAVAPFDAVKGVWPVNETASIAAFNVAPDAGQNPVALIDPGSGVAPLPNDLLRTDADGTIINNPAFGPAAGGLDTLDGFSTTAMMLAQVSKPIKAGTVRGENVFLYKLDGGTATMVPEFRAVAGSGGNPATAQYIAEPTPIVDPTCGITGGCSIAIGLQPAVKIPVAPGVSFYMPPLEEGTLYAIVMTNRVLGIADQPLAKSTVAKIILDGTAPVYLPDNPATPGVVDPVSLLAGVSVDTARTIQQMRADLAPVWTALPAGTTKADVVTAYTFKTQSIVETALELAAAPYGIEQAAGTTAFDVVSATDITGAPGVPTLPGVGRIIRVVFRSFDGIDKGTGAFRPTLADELDPAAWVGVDPHAQPGIVELSAYVTIPSAVAGSCPAGYPGGTHCAPLAVVGHGLNGSKTTLFAVAAELAAQGYIGVATDFPLHGDRNWCAADTDCTTDGVTPDGTCDKGGDFAGSAGQGDAVPPGVCAAPSFPLPGGSRYFVSANFFRIRDSFRQNLLDQSALVLALARPLPSNPLGAVLPAGTFVDPRFAHYLGISLGSIAGTSVVATNPRITRATLDVGGGTFADIAINAPAFKAELEPLFAALIPGFTWEAVTPGDPAFDAGIAAEFLQLVNVAKWVLDPGDPINFASHVVTDPLPNLLAGGAPQVSKPTLGLISAGDTVVPNDQNELLFALMAATTTRYDSNRPAGTDGSGIPYAANSVPHGIIGALPPVTPTNPVEYVTAGAQVRADATAWLTGTVPPATRTFDLTP